MDANSNSPQLTEAAQVELTELKANTADLKAQTQSLSRETLNDYNHTIRTLQIRAAHITNEVLPISRLPPEVLSIVFHEACRMPIDWWGMDRPLPTEVRLSHVCRRWRAVTLGSRALWAVLRVPVIYSEPAVEAYLERCGQCPLTFQLGPGLSHHRIVAILSSILVPHISQVQVLILDTETRRELDIMLGILANLAAPGLRRPRIMTSDGSHTPIPRKIFSLGALLLSDVRLDPVSVTLPPAPLSMLHFEMHPRIATHISPSNVLNIIKPYAASLTVLHLCGLCISQEDPGSDPIVLPALRELVTCGLDGINTFWGISAPMLHSLVLHGIRRKDLSLIHKFMVRTHPERFHHLHSLHYIECDMDANLNIYLLHVTAALEELLVTTNYGQPHLLLLLLNGDRQAISDGTPPLWPQLRTLTIHVSGGWPRSLRGEETEGYDVHSDIVLLLELVQVRKAVGSRLDMLRIKGPNALVLYDHLAPALASAQAEVVVVVVVTDMHHTKELEFVVGDRHSDGLGGVEPFLYLGGS